MATRTISASGGTRLWSDTASWDEAAVPTAADDVVARGDGTSGALTIAATGNCRSIVLTHYSSTLTINASQFLVIGDASGGALSFPNTMTLAANSSATVDFVSTSTNGGTGWPITTNGALLPQVLFNGTGGKWQLQDALNWNGALTFQRGAFDSNSKTMTGNTVTRSGTNTLVVTLDNSTINLNSTTATVTLWTLTSTSLTFSATGSTINLTGVASTGARTFAGGGLTYGALSYTTAGASGLTITGANTFTTLTVTGAVRTLTFPASATTTATTLVLNGVSSGSLLTIVSSSGGTAATLSVAAGTVTADSVSLKDSTATGGATFRATNATNVSGNTGWIFVRALTGTTAGAATTAAGLTLYYRTFAGSTAGVSGTGAPALGIPIHIAGTTAGTGTLTTTSLPVRRPMAGAIHGVSTMSAPTLHIPCRPATVRAYRNTHAYRAANSFRGVPLGRNGVVLLTEIAFAVDPASNAPVWTDVSCHVRSVSVHRGRQHELDKPEAGTATIVLDNRERDFDPSFTASPYYPHVVPMRRIRITASAPNAAESHLFSGYIENWPQSYTQPHDATVQVTAVDGFRAFAAANLPESPWTLEVRADEPDAWWRLGESTGQLQAFDSSGNNRNGIYQSVQLGVTSLVTNDSDSAINNAQTANGRVSIPFTDLFDGFPFTVECWVRLAEDRDTSKIIFSGLGNISGASDGIIVDVANEADNPGRGGAIEFVVRAAGTTSRTYSSVTVDDGDAHHIVCVATSASVLSVYVDGVDVSIVNSSALSGFPTIRAGFAIANAPSSDYGSYPFNGSGSGDGIDEVAIYNRALSETRIFAHYNAGGPAWAGDTTGERIVRVLDWLGWSDTDRNIDTGSSTLTTAGFGGSVLDYLQLLLTTEQGGLFMQADGKLRLRARNAIFLPPYNSSQATFGDGAGELKYADIVLNDEDQQIRNYVTVTRRGGTPQIAQDADSQASYFRHSYDLGTVEPSTDNEALSAAQWIVGHYKDPQVRVDQLTLRPLRDTTNLIPQVLLRELGDRITVKRRPQNFGAAISTDVSIEGITHEITVDSWTTTWALGPIDTQVYWVLGQGALDSTSRLAY